MKKINKLLLGLFLALGVLVSLNSVSATDVYVDNGINFVTPLASGTVTGSYALNVTNMTTIFPVPLNCTFYAGSASTANTTWTEIATGFNSTGIRYINATFNSATIEDSNDYQLRASCRNMTNDVANTTITLITFASTTPTAPSSISPADGQIISTATTQTFSSTVVDRETTGCTYTAYRYGSSSDSESSSGTATYAGSTCSFSKTFSVLSDNGDYAITFIASDGTDTSSATTHFLVNIPGTNGGLSGGNGESGCSLVGELCGGDSGYSCCSGATCTMTSDNISICQIGETNSNTWLIILIGVVIVIIIAIIIVKH